MAQTHHYRPELMGEPPNHSSPLQNNQWWNSLPLTTPHFFVQYDEYLARIAELDSLAAAGEPYAALCALAAERGWVDRTALLFTGGPSQAQAGRLAGAAAASARS